MNLHGDAAARCATAVGVKQPASLTSQAIEPAESQFVQLPQVLLDSLLVPRETFGHS